MHNEVVIWDKIIRSKDEARLNLVDKHKYAFRELSTSFECVATFLFPSLLPFFASRIFLITAPAEALFITLNLARAHHARRH